MAKPAVKVKTAKTAMYPWIWASIGERSTIDRTNKEISLSKRGDKMR
jgi:hypothetical protein